ncbi:hypothetical protein HPP92_007473 [Vanilla planifolia]|uniref:Uncharacterized protein n=1 Tax=Vanilla planifolia TaxID=51239 RepID=A0A835RE48_VANPL|nr:hypothetical protein HPP92_007473 [Vanilla planifolia]
MKGARGVTWAVKDGFVLANRGKRPMWYVHRLDESSELLRRKESCRAARLSHNNKLLLKNKQ